MVFEVWSTYEEVGLRADAFGSGLVNLELCPQRPDPEVRGRGLLGRDAQLFLRILKDFKGFQEVLRV